MNSETILILGCGTQRSGVKDDTEVFQIKKYRVQSTIFIRMKKEVVKRKTVCSVLNISSLIFK